MNLVEIFIPQYYPNGRKIESNRLKNLQQELAERFGGVTAFVRSSASGLWEDEDGHVKQDEIAVFEVMAAELDRDWWKSFRQKLEAEFDQDEILIRATQTERI